MPDLLKLREDLERYRRLRFWLGDAAMREHLTQLIKTTQAKITEGEAKNVHRPAPRIARSRAMEL